MRVEDELRRAKSYIFMNIRALLWNWAMKGAVALAETEDALEDMTVVLFILTRA
jgi:hypothetical protein